MSKLAHSSDVHMAEIERNNAARGDKDEPDPVFTLDDDYVKKARADHWFQAGPGSLVQTPDGNLWTVVYNSLDGYGVIEGDHPNWIGAADFGELPPPTHMLRNAYKRHPDDIPVQFIGEIVRVIRRVKPDNTVVEHRELLETSTKQSSTVE